MSVTTADVVKLRHATGAGMMDCKNALIEAEGNFDRAIEIIRERGNWSPASVPTGKPLKDAFWPG